MIFCHILPPSTGFVDSSGFFLQKKLQKFVIHFRFQFFFAINIMKKNFVLLKSLDLFLEVLCSKERWKFPGLCGFC